MIQCNVFLKSHETEQPKTTIYLVPDNFFISVFKIWILEFAYIIYFHSPLLFIMSKTASLCGQPDERSVPEESDIRV